MADSFAKISSMIESARDITIEAAVSASTRLTETPTAKRPQEIVKLLSSRLDREILNGMKCVIALISSGEDASMYFADVVKNVTSTNARVRALVMIYVEKYAESEPDTALLSINSVQKSLNDKSENARSASIRTLGGIRIPEIASLLVLCIKRTITDRSPEVRSATALAIGSAFTIDGISKIQLLGHLSTLMSDPSPIVVGTCVKVYVKLRPQLLKLSHAKTWAPLHSNYKRYVRLLPDLDEWSRCMLTDILVEYCRKFIPRPTLTFVDGSKKVIPEDFGSFPRDYECEMDPDLESFVNSLSLAAYSTSNMVILSAVRALISVATPIHVNENGFPKILIKMMVQSTSEPEKSHILQLITILASIIPENFQVHARKFFLHPKESTHISIYKLEILSKLFTEETAGLIIKELQFNSGSYRREVSQSAVNAIGLCCQKYPDWADKILHWCLLEMTKESAKLIIADLLKVIRVILQRQQDEGLDSVQTTKTIYRLSLVLQTPHVQLNEDAKASIIWTIGEFTEVTENTIGPDVLRQSLKTYAHETEKVRYELLILAAKAYSYEIQRLSELSEEVQPSTTKKMFDHVMHLARYDMSTSTRDKARMLDELFRDISNHQLAYLFMQAPKAVPQLTGQKYNSAFLSRYLKTSKWADASTIPPSSIRKEAGESKSSILGLRDNSWNSNTVSSMKESILGSSKTGQFKDRPSSSNQLQSLDEFFGDEDESDESSNDENESDVSSGEEQDNDSSEISESESDSEVYESESDSDDVLLDGSKGK